MMDSRINNTFLNLITELELLATFFRKRAELEDIYADSLHKVVLIPFCLDTSILNERFRSLFRSKRNQRKSATFRFVDFFSASNDSCAL